METRCEQPGRSPAVLARRAADRLTSRRTEQIRRAGRKVTRLRRSNSGPPETVPALSAAGGLPERPPDLVVHRAQVRRDELAVVGLARGGQILPAGDRAAAPRGTAQAHGREVVDRAVAHR